MKKPKKKHPTQTTPTPEPREIPPFVKGNKPSVAAALSMMSEAKTLQDKVEATILSAGKLGYTTEEVEERVGRKHQSVSARVKKLKDLGRVIDSGVQRMNTSRRKAAVIVHDRYKHHHPPCAKCGERGVNCDCTWEEQDAAEASL